MLHLGRLGGYEYQREVSVYQFHDTGNHEPASAIVIHFSIIF